MNPITEQKINALRIEVAQSTLDPSDKDAAQEVIDKAAICAN